MALLIDGYNLLHVTGIVGRGIGPGSLERSRNALLNFLAESIEERELSRTTVVFDAKDAPSGLPCRVKHGSISVLYSRDFPDADSQIESILETHSSPRKLLVVSSDHRVQRAAQRRRAQFIDSDVWYAKLIEQRRARNAPQTRASAKPSVPLTDGEVAYWLDQFAPETAPEDPQGHNPNRGLGNNTSRKPPATDEEFYNPFPPGYAEDVENDL